MALLPIDEEQGRDTEQVGKDGIDRASHLESIGLPTMASRHSHPMRDCREESTRTFLFIQLMKNEEEMWRG